MNMATISYVIRIGSVKWDKIRKLLIPINTFHNICDSSTLVIFYTLAILYISVTQKNLCNFKVKNKFIVSQNPCQKIITPWSKEKLLEKGKYKELTNFWEQRGLAMQQIFVTRWGAEQTSCKKNQLFT